VKAIAPHGLGLYIYAGEDLPQVPTTDAGAANDDVGRAPAEERSRSNVRPLPKSSLVPTITKAQQAQIHKVAIEVGISLDRVLGYFGVSELHHIATTDFPRVIRSLENRRAA
jgi:hypothetical protein